MVLVMLLVAQHLNTWAAVGTRVPLMYKPVLLTQSLLHPPGASTAVQVIEVLPAKLPRIMLHPLVVALQPALHPRNMLFEAVVLLKPAHNPENKLLVPVLLLQPA